MLHPLGGARFFRHVNNDVQLVHGARHKGGGVERHQQKVLNWKSNLKVVELATWPGWHMEQKAKLLSRTGKTAKKYLEDFCTIMP